ncbi:Na(+)-translocating NADH-quinone reductase subunit C [Rodentibacter pneumotropicus]|uniref:Na(+)-translocating NADH-quinone reductase subunit C n=1 Tax=Rodentibacter pneumotropicus TaxID=758 RepID=A0A3S4XS64_9PAST|nr:Na(+)-translocating NADH-quinone reductase subunit C [Rodentibacter pneumotropicus]
MKGQAPKDDHSIDGLSGATLTGNGVQGTFDYWFSENGFSKYLENFKQERTNVWKNKFKRSVISSYC